MPVYILVIKSIVMYRNFIQLVIRDKENVAIKTGTPEADDYEHPDAYQFNSALVGFYPADNPEIAFGVILEHGEFARVMSANIVKAYATGTINTNYDEDGQPLTIL